MSTTEAEIDQLRAEMKKLRDEIEQLARTLGRAARAGAREAGEAVCDATQDFRASVRQSTERLTGTIEDNPVVAALVALSIGMLLGRLFFTRER